MNLEQVDKQNLVGTPTKIADDMISALKTKGKHGCGHRNQRNRQKLRENEASPSWVQQCWDAIWTISDGDSEPIEPLGDLQPELEIGNDHSLFTRASDTINPRRIEEILKQVAIGPNLSDEAQSKVHNLISEFVDCLALSVREVLPVPGTEHRIHIPPDVVFLKKITYQRQLTVAQCQDLSDAIDELLAADIIEPIRSEDVKCASPITLAQKVHTNPGLSLDKLCHRVNEECIANGIPPIHNVEAPDVPTMSPTKDSAMSYDPMQPQKWHIWQNYRALNKVTQVFPMPQGDICTKQCRLSGHRWVHGFDFA